MRFFPQYKFEELLDLPIHIYETMLLGMRQLKAEEQLYRMDSSLYAHMERKAMERTRKRYYKEAFPQNFEHRTIRNEDLKLV